MTRLLLIAALATAAVAAHAPVPAYAQSGDERFAQPGGMPAFVTRIRGWLGTRSSGTQGTSSARAPRRVAARVAAPKAAPKPAPKAAATPAPAPIPTPKAKAKPAKEPAQKPARKIEVAHASVPETQAVAQAPQPSPRVEPAAPFAARFAAATDPPVRTASRATGCSGQRVTAAYYWQGTRTASGARFDPHAMTAAHRTLPFGTKLTVTNPRTGQSVDVTINDRGPFVRGVAIDLSLGAAKAIGMRGTGAVCLS